MMRKLTYLAYAAKTWALRILVPRTLSSASSTPSTEAGTAEPGATCHLEPISSPGMQTSLETTTADPADLAMLRAELGPDSAPLGWETVRAFEAEHQITLPEPYRSYVATIADGSYLGPPEYGLMELTALPSDWGAGRPSRVLSKPFPLSAEWLWAVDERPEAEYADALDTVFDHGSIVLGTDGCGMYWHLVVTGTHRGHVWHITELGAMPFGAEFGYTTAQPGFAGWVRHWAAGKDWWDVG